MIVETLALSKRFAGHEAVRDISLKVPEGSAVALIGSNGAGKTTTLRLLMNLIQPDAGEARVLGVDSRKLSYPEFRRIGYVAENQVLPERLRISQYFAYLRTLYPTWDRDLETDLLGQLDLKGEMKLSKLSHGMRLKTALASTLAFRPELLVLDEPLGGLDPLVRDEVLEGLIGQASNMTVIISSHELSEIEGFATHVAFIDKGRLVFQQSMDDLVGRFRDVLVPIPEGVTVSGKTPPGWLNVEIGARNISFVDSAYAGEDVLARQLAMIDPKLTRIDARPMPLRSISKALMLDARGGAR